MEKVFIYGAGNMGKAVLELLSNRCEVKGFIDGNLALQGSRISGVPVYHLSNMDSTDKLCDAVLVAMTVCPFTKMKEILSECGFHCIVPAGDYVAEQYIYDEILNTWKFQGEYDTLSFSDEKSIYDYNTACQWFSQRTDKDWNLEDNKYFPIFLSSHLSQCRVMVDTAALDGGYIDAFLQKNTDRYVYAHILTPSTLSINSLREKYSPHHVHFFENEASEKDGTENCRRIGLMQPFTKDKTYHISTQKIDSSMKNTVFDYLRCYSMSEILPILQGGEQTIQQYRPIIAANIGHYKSDFFQVPLYLMKQCLDYKFYFRMHSYQGNDCILYAVPDEK